MRQASPIPSVALVGGIPRVSSLDIAERFGKPHKDVLNVIRRIIADLAPDFMSEIFRLCPWTSKLATELSANLLPIT